MTTPTKPKVLIVAENWADCDPRRGLSVQHANFIASLTATGLADVATFFIDECVMKTGQHADDLLIPFCAEYRPDMVLLKMVRGSDLNPSAQTLTQLRQAFGAKIVSVYGDTFDEFAIRWIESYSDSVDFNVMQDCYSTYTKLVPDASKYLPLWTPQDPALFYNAEEARDIDVIFLGSVARYPERKLGLAFLEASGIPLLRRGGQSEDSLTMSDYARLLRHAKISINFSRAVFGDPAFQCKGRVFETTLCGTLLLEQKNPETTTWFVPGRHYVEFTDERDLLRKATYYLTHEDERCEIAACGAAMAHECYSAVPYWRRIFEAVFPVGETT